MKSASSSPTWESHELVPCEIVLEQSPFAAPASHAVADETLWEPRNYRLMGLIELILKDRDRLHRLIRNSSLSPELIPRLLAIACLGFMFYGAAMAIVLTCTQTWPALTAIASWLERPTHLPITFLGESGAGLGARWLDGAAFKLIAAYTLGLIAATGVCLPSLYFYGLLSGVRMSMLDCTVHALKSKATSAVALVGILPIYTALVMGMIVLPVPQVLLHAALLLGLILPFIAGLWGTYSLYIGFTELCDTLPLERQARRQCFLRRLVLSWAAVYTAITPVMIFSLWSYLESI